MKTASCAAFKLCCVIMLWSFAAIFVNMLVLMPLEAQTAKKSVTDIVTQFSQVRKMYGDFVQFDSKGRVNEGNFYMERPGKIRFNYFDAPVRVMADGRSVAIQNKSLNTWNLYQLSQTPLKMLLDDRVDLSAGRLVSAQQKDNMTKVVLQDKTLGRGYIRMVFNNQTAQLLQWTIVDQQNIETTVQIKKMTVLTPQQRFEDTMFTIPYQDIAMQRR